MGLVGCLAWSRFSGVHAMTRTLHRFSFLTSWPYFEMRYRVELDPIEVTVKRPALEQSDQFCHYTFMNRRLQPIHPKVAWTPCYGIDKVFSTP